MHISRFCAKSEIFARWHDRTTARFRISVVILIFKTVLFLSTLVHMTDHFVLANGNMQPQMARRNDSESP